MNKIVRHWTILCVVFLLAVLLLYFSSGNCGYRFFSFFDNDDSNSRSVVVRERTLLVSLGGLEVSSSSLSKGDRVLRQSETLAELVRRRARVRRVCSELRGRREEKKEGVTDSYMLDRKHGLLFCRNAKAGTSTWLEYFLQLSDLPTYVKETLGTNNRILHEQIPIHFNLTQYNISTVQDLKAFVREHGILTTSFVRNPFDRLASAFEDKVLHRRDRLYHPLADKLNGSFQSFANHVVQEFAEKCGFSSSQSDFAGQDCSSVDVHWRRFVDRCDFCELDFHVIGHLESFDDDAEIVLESRGMLQQGIGEGLLKKNSAVAAAAADSPQTPRESGGSAKTVRYFATADPATLRSLRVIYDVDFQLFGYDGSQFLYGN